MDDADRRLLESCAVLIVVKVFGVLVLAGGAVLPHALSCFGIRLAKSVADY